ncbi:MAG: hypothetical protein JWR11_6249 [Mycobacterium sp.]|jgi:hypothetical protein|nr:hypothetical protein [Mycobacterium sp.]MDT5067422.1 hypothetical protein [Mycobacterium sp.]
MSELTGITLNAVDGADFVYAGDIALGGGAAGLRRLDHLGLTAMRRLTVRHRMPRLLKRCRLLTFATGYRLH